MTMIAGVPHQLLAIRSNYRDTFPNRVNMYLDGATLNALLILCSMHSGGWVTGGIEYEDRVYLDLPILCLTSLTNN